MESIVFQHNSAHKEVYQHTIEEDFCLALFVFNPIAYWTHSIKANF